MEDLTSNIDGAVDTVTGAVGAAVGWWASKFGTSKAAKVGFFVAAFIAVALVLTVVNKLFT